MSGPCQGLSVPILAYAHRATELDCVLLKDGHSLQMMRLQRQLVHANLNIEALQVHNYSALCHTLWHYHASPHRVLSLAQARPKQCLHSCSYVI